MQYYDDGVTVETENPESVIGTFVLSLQQTIINLHFSGFVLS